MFADEWGLVDGRFYELQEAVNYITLVKAMMISTQLILV
jgi:hypothetical protein